jgi:hypothetical protein
MIDFVKCYVLDKNRFEDHIVNTKLIDLTMKFNQNTGEIEEYPKRGKDGNLDVVINNVRAFVSGSIHKHYNILHEKGNQNYDDFYYSQLESEIRGLIKKYRVNKDTSFTNLEIGFNLIVNKDPQFILDNNILMNNYKAPSKNLKFSGKGDYKDFQMTDYTIRIYNKSKQLKLDKNILRVELKIKNKRFLHSLGVFELEDLLDKEVLKSLFRRFIEAIEGLIIVDVVCPQNIPEIEYTRIISYTNPIYWINLKSTKSPKVNSRLKKDFIYLLNKYELLNTKNQLLELLDNKFSELIEIDTFKDVA